MWISVLLKSNNSLKSWEGKREEALYGNAFNRIIISVDNWEDYFHVAKCIKFSEEINIWHFCFKIHQNSLSIHQIMNITASGRTSKPLEHLLREAYRRINQIKLPIMRNTLWLRLKIQEENWGPNIMISPYHFPIPPNLQHNHQNLQTLPKTPKNGQKRKTPKTGKI